MANVGEGEDRSRAARWSGSAYAATAAHHRTLDAWFLERHEPAPGDTIVDLGSGSGEFSARLAALVPDGRVIGIEPDPSMLAAARRHQRPNLEFVAARAEELDAVVPPNSVDLVVSRAMLHWVRLDRYPRVFEAVFRVLRPGGWFHSESGGAGNVALIERVMREVGAEHGLVPNPTFPDAGLAYELLEAAGFEIPIDGVRTVAQRRAFDRDELIAFLRAQAVVVMTRDAPPEVGEAFVEAFLGQVDRLRRWDDSFDQTFVRLEVLVRRPT